MRGLVLGFIAMLALAGCATTARYEQVLASWVGETEGALVSSWGPPVDVYQAPDGMRVLTYRSAGNIFIPGTSPTYTSTVVGNTVYTQAHGGTAPTSIPLACTTNFTVVGGVITSWRWQGNNCTSR